MLYSTVRPSSHRTVLSVTTIALAIMTALVLMQLARFVSPPDSSRTAPTINRAVIDRFYNAINTTIATGDAGTLNNHLAPNFSITSDNLPEATGPAGLIEHLLALHRSHPTLRLVVRDHVADAKTAIVWVEIEESSADTVLANPLGAFAGEITDRLTIVHGKVSQLRGVIWNLTPAVLLAQTAIQQPATDVQIGLARMTLDGTTAPFVLSGLGPVVIVVESGSVKVQGGTSGTWSRPSGGSMSTASAIDGGVNQQLLPGEQFVSPDGSFSVLLNDSQTPATVLVIAVIPRVEWIRATSRNINDIQRSTIIVMMTAIDETQAQPNNALPLGIHVIRLVVRLVRLDEGEHLLRLERLDLSPRTEVVMNSRAVSRLIVLDHDDAGLVILNRHENGQENVMSVFAPGFPVLTQPLTQNTIRNLDERLAPLLILSWQ